MFFSLSRPLKQTPDEHAVDIESEARTTSPRCTIKNEKTTPYNCTSAVASSYVPIYAEARKDTTFKNVAGRRDAPIEFARYSQSHDKRIADTVRVTGAIGRCLFGP